MKVGLFFDCGQPLIEISVHSFLIGWKSMGKHSGVMWEIDCSKEE